MNFKTFLIAPLLFYFACNASTNSTNNKINKVAAAPGNKNENPYADVSAIPLPRDLKE